MDPKLVKSISTEIFRRFPEIAGSQPRVSTQAAPKSAAHPIPTYLLTYRGSARTSDGKSIPRIVRVIANAQGRILKVTTSR
jgi:hypothetical protein